jgi:hypothetical protein
MTVAAVEQEGTEVMTTQKSQMLASTSPGAAVAAERAALVAAQNAPKNPPADPAAATLAATTVDANLPNARAKGEKCQTCGQVMPDDDDGDPADPDAKTPPVTPAAAAAPAEYTVEMAMETMDLCAIAKVPVADAKAFVAAKTPIAGVRTQLAARAAAAADALAVDGTARPTGASEQAVATAWDEVVTAQNAKLPGAKR